MKIRELMQTIEVELNKMLEALLIIGLAIIIASFTPYYF